MPFLINPFLIRTAGLVPIDLSTGTIYGDMNEGAAETNAFDGTTNRGFSTCAAKVTGTNSYISRVLPAAKIFGQAMLYGSNDRGFLQSNSSLTINIRGKHTAPSNHNDAGSTVIGSVTFTDTADESAGRLVTSTDLVTAWEYIWPHYAVGGGNTNLYCAQFQLWEWAP